MPTRIVLNDTINCYKRRDQTNDRNETYDINQTHDRNIANDRNDPNDGNETNQTNDANVFTCRAKRCLKLNFEPKLWFKNMDVTLENQFYL